MRFRKLRIAWSVGWGIACVLLIALWIRSYWRYFGYSGSRGDEFIEVAVFKSELHLYRGPHSYDGSRPWRVFSEPLVSGSDSALEYNRKQYASRLGVGWRRFGLFGWVLQASISLWWPSLLTVALATLPWLRFRFTLRSLLIATTLVAVVLGLAVWAIR
jgi:hypothetical protein